MPPASKNPGVEFEQAVAALQARLDPASAVTHNEFLVDRHGQRRQFDVVMRGSFGGQPLLGVIECKDLKSRVGTPEVDAFTTKASDINANLRLLISRRGFTKPALQKAKHYGIQCLSLVERDPVNSELRVGGYWYGFLRRWQRLEVRVELAEGSAEVGKYDPYALRLRGHRVIDWYINQLIDLIKSYSEPGWTEVTSVQFAEVQDLEWEPGSSCRCTGLHFRAELQVEEKESFVGVRGDGFFDWQTNTVAFAGSQTLVTDGVPTDLRLWADRQSRAEGDGVSIDARVYAFSLPAEHVPDALDLTAL